MSATDLRELRGILSGFSMTDIAQMKTAERRMTSLRSVKKPLDHAREDQLSLVKVLPYDELYLDGMAYNELREFILEDPLSFLIGDA